MIQTQSNHTLAKYRTYNKKEVERMNDYMERNKLKMQEQEREKESEK